MGFLTSIFKIKHNNINLVRKSPLPHDCIVWFFEYYHFNIHFLIMNTEQEISNNEVFGIHHSLFNIRYFFFKREVARIYKIIICCY